MGRHKDAQTAALGRQFGQNLTELRGHVGLSQTATAERAGLHRTEVALVEHGRRIPRLDTLVKLAGAVEVAPCELLAGLSWRLDTSRGRSW
ncbi:MAG TPA: helix-turn-helix transcriptional regulator [Solirubrobacterales bacterium]|nr:helix-turn-helix transcriptional regulator [Solirubrobacterales bacterium]